MPADRPPPDEREGVAAQEAPATERRRADAKPHRVIDWATAGVVAGVMVSIAAIIVTVLLFAIEGVDDDVDQLADRVQHVDEKVQALTVSVAEIKVRLETGTSASPGVGRRVSHNPP